MLPGIFSVTGNAATLVRAGVSAVSLRAGASDCPRSARSSTPRSPSWATSASRPSPSTPSAASASRAATLDAARAIARRCPSRSADAGCFAIVLECVPDAVAPPRDRQRRRPDHRHRRGAPLPDGQVLVFHDLVGLGDPRVTPKFVRRYADLAGDAPTAAVERFADDVRAGPLPVERRDVPRLRMASPTPSASTAGRPPSTPPCEAGRRRARRHAGAAHPRRAGRRVGAARESRGAWRHRGDRAVPGSHPDDHPPRGACPARGHRPDRNPARGRASRTCHARPVPRDALRLPERLERRLHDVDRAGRGARHRVLRRQRAQRRPAADDAVPLPRVPVPRVRERATRSATPSRPSPGDFPAVRSPADAQPTRTIVPGSGR